MNRFARHLGADDKVEIRMSVVKPQTNMNKEVKIRIAGMFAEKTADTFEEGIDACLAALEGQLERRKNG
jgi:ribosome-associated translation inhibitor RaiA